MDLKELLQVVYDLYQTTHSSSGFCLSVQKLFSRRGIYASFPFLQIMVRFIARLRHFRRVWRRARAIARLVCRTLAAGVIYTRFFFYKQLHFWVQPGVAKAFLQFQPQGCLMVASSVQISAVVAYELVANGCLMKHKILYTSLCPRFHVFTFSVGCSISLKD